MKPSNETKCVELERFKRLRLNQSTPFEALRLVSTPKGDTILCPLNGGRVTQLKINDKNDEESPQLYYPDCRMEGNYIDMYECNVDEIAFSPFDFQIFLVRWSNGLIGVFHASKPMASIYWNTWNYLPQSSESEVSNKKKDVSHDFAISMRWSRGDPCTFFVLTKLGYLVDFKLSQQQQTSILLHETELVQNSLFLDCCFSKLLPSCNGKMLPSILTRTTCSNLFSLVSRYEDCDRKMSTDVRSEIENLRRVVLQR